MTDLETFRDETRAWLEVNCPPEMRQPTRAEEDYCWGGRTWTFQSEAQRLWLERTAERGWTAPEWPREYGGGGLTREEAKVLRREMERIRARPPLASFGVWMLGPALLRYGTEEQKRHHLPPIARGYPEVLRVGAGISRIGRASYEIAQGLFQSGVCIGVCDTVISTRVTGPPIRCRRAFARRWSSGGCLSRNSAAPSAAGAGRRAMVEAVLPCSTSRIPRPTASPANWPPRRARA